MGSQKGPPPSHTTGQGNNGRSLYGKTLVKLNNPEDSVTTGDRFTDYTAVEHRLQSGEPVEFGAVRRANSAKALGWRSRRGRRNVLRPIGRDFCGWRVRSADGFLVPCVRPTVRWDSAVAGRLAASTPPLVASAAGIGAGKGQRGRATVVSCCAAAVERALLLRWRSAPSRRETAAGPEDRVGALFGSHHTATYLLIERQTRIS